MRNVVLTELARRWVLDTQTPDIASEGGKEAEMSNAVEAAVRATKRECADALLTLIDVMPDS